MNFFGTPALCVLCDIEHAIEDNFLTVLVLTAAWLLSLVQTTVYACIKVRGKSKAYTISKCLGSALFCLLGAYALVNCIAKGENIAFSAMLLAAFVFSAFGDYFLSLPEGHKRLKLGIISFSSAHIIFFIAFALAGGFFLWQLAVYLCVLLVVVASLRIFKFNFRGMKNFVFAYTALVTLMATQALAVAFSRNFPLYVGLPIAIGGALFFISDLVWSIYGFSSFKRASLLKVINVYTYFFGQMFIASGAVLMCTSF